MKTYKEFPKEFETNDNLYKKKPIPVYVTQINEPFKVETLEGTMNAKAGDYLIQGIEGEVYACDKRIFEKSYEKQPQESYNDYGKTMMIPILFIGTLIAFIYNIEGKFIVLMMFSVITIAEFFLRRQYKKEHKND